MQRPLAAARLSARKKLLFAVVTTMCFFAVVEAAFFVAGYRPKISEQDPYVGFTSRIPLFVPDGTSGQMVTAQNKLAWFNEQRFDKVKAPGCYRTFCLGGSTTYGRPYDDATSFCGWLREFLAVAAPDVHWEVINAGGISYASYRVALLLEELAEYQPDLLIVYTGHNEFLEDRTYAPLRESSPLLRDMHLALSHSRAYSAMHALVHGADSTPAARQFLLAGEVATRLDKGVGPDAYFRDDQLQQQILRHFRLNLSRIVSLAGAAGAKVMFVTPASNLKDCSPFKSEFSEGLNAEDQTRFHQLLDDAQKSISERAFEQALGSVDAALLLDARYAEAQFLRGRCCEALGEFTAAKDAYMRARDEDVCPLRALTPMRDMVLEAGGEAGIPAVDFARLAEHASPEGITGEELFLDHVHPTIEGHRMLALAIIQSMRECGLLHIDSQWGDNAIQRVTAAVNSRVDAKQQGIALRNLAKVFTWAGKHEEANRLALRAAELDRGAESLYLAANALIERGDFAGAIAKLQQSVALSPNDAQAYVSLGVAYQHSGQPDQAKLQYERALQLDPENASVHNNLGALFVATGQWDLATRHLQRALEINPRYAKAHHNLGGVLTKQKKWREAIESFSRAIQIDPNFARAHQDLGRVQELRGSPRQAVFHYRRALQLDPQLLPTANVLAWLLSTSTDPKIRDGQEALRWALKCAEGTGFQQPSVLNTLAAAYAETGDFARAVQWQTKALEQAPEAFKPTCRERIRRYEAGQPCRDEQP